MRKVILNEFLTLDGVAQAPGAADEDPSGGFAHGGWHMRYMEDDTARAWVMQGLTSSGGLILGRVTYEIFAAYWPNAPEEEEAFATPINSMPKHVASTTLTEPLDWQNSSLLQGDVPDAVSALKRGDGGDLHVIGSTRLAQTLIAHGVVDEYRFMIDPIMLGRGKRVFPDDTAARPLRLADCQVAATGAILATYVPDDA